MQPVLEIYAPDGFDLWPVTEIESFRSKWVTINDLVQRSKVSVRKTNKMYGNRAWNFDVIEREL